VVREEIDATAANRSNWDAWAAVHGRGQDAYYDLDAMVAGRDSLTDVELAALEVALGAPVSRPAGLAGRDVLQVQCHFGLDAVSLARRGARVTGVDFSPVAVRRAAELADRCGVDVRYLEGDSTDLPSELHGQFDVAYATFGVLCWIGDVDAWMRSVTACLRPGGRLVLIDGHPLKDVLRWQEPYAFDGPHVYTATGSYAGVDTPEPTTNVQFAHSVGEIVTAAAGAGLRVLRLVEHLDSPVDLAVLGQADPDGRYRLRHQGQPVPMLFTLVAER
jgi:SAM-dependent methyltransferase